MLVGRLLESVSNYRSRWMVISLEIARQNPAYRATLPNGSQYKFKQRIPNGDQESSSKGLNDYGHYHQQGLGEHPLSSRLSFFYLFYRFWVFCP